MEQKLVVHKKDGAIHKGVTHDFDPETEEFHFLPAEGGGVPVLMRVEEMKALFWVKDYLGNRQFVAQREFGADHAKQRKAIVTFQDGEELWGTVEGEPEGERGFFLSPADARDNNVRIFVVRSALKEMRLVS
jgi:hypothetical protein